MRIRRIRGPRPWLESLRETFGKPLCRLQGHALPMLADLHYEVRSSVLIGSIEHSAPAPIRHVERAVVCWRCNARIGD